MAEFAHQRRSVRLQGYDYDAAGFYSLTLCVEGRRCLFGRVINGAVVLSRLGELVIMVLEESEHVRPDSDEWVVMPNHLHLIVGIHRAPDEEMQKAEGRTSRAPLQKIPERLPRSISSFIAGFKATTTHRAKDAGLLFVTRLWQRSFHDHIIRSQQDLEQHRNYILLNPEHWEKDEEFVDLIA